MKQFRLGNHSSFGSRKLENSDSERGFPERTCVACRKKASKAVLKRFVIDDEGKMVIDNLYRLPGRGAYLHAQCLEKAGVSDKTKEKLMFSLKKHSLKKK